MRTIWKYVFNGASEIVREGMLAPKVIHTGMDPAGHGPAVWVEHYPTQPENFAITPATLTLLIVGTGQVVPDKFRHVGSMQDGPFMWHVYEHQIGTWTP